MKKTLPHEVPWWLAEPLPAQLLLGVILVRFVSCNHPILPEFAFDLTGYGASGEPSPPLVLEPLE